jgi:hypothetical protein
MSKNISDKISYKLNRNIMDSYFIKINNKITGYIPPIGFLIK